MKALITNSYIHVSNIITDLSHHNAYKKWIADNKGKWVDIDTNCVFDNQYNTYDGYRIYDSHIDKIEDDVRTSRGAFFVNHPNGKDPIKKVNFKDHLKNERFLSCYSVNGNYYRISRRSTIEFILVRSIIYTYNGIGYKTIKESRLTANEIKILKYCANRILKGEL